MFDSKLVDLLQRISNKLFKQLSLMIESPYFNKKKELIRFYKFFQKHHPNYTEKKLTYEKAHAYVFPDQPFDKKEIGYLMTDMVRMIEYLLVQERMEQQTGLKEFFLMKSYLDLELDKAFSQTLKAANKRIESQTYKDGLYFLNKNRLYSLKNDYFSKKQKHKNDESLQLAVNNLDLFYLTEKMRLACEMMNRQNMIKVSYEYPLIDEIQSFLNENPDFSQSHPSILIYSLIFKGFIELEADVELFDELLKLLHQYSDIFPPVEAKGLYVHAINFCTRKIHSGKSYFVNKVFELYKSILTKDLILSEGHISPWTYMNIVTVGVRCNELAWTEHFIEEYKDQLQPNFKENAYHYNLAYLYFNQQQYEKAIDQLNYVVFDDVYYSCESRSLLMRIYYSNDEIDAFYSLIDSFRIFLRRNKVITDRKKTMYLNQIKFINRLAKIIKGDNEGLESLENQIKETKLVVNEEWLLDQIRLKMK